MRVKHPWENADAEGLSSARSEAGATSVGEFDGDSVYDDSKCVHGIASGWPSPALALSVLQTRENVRTLTKWREVYTGHARICEIKIEVEDWQKMKVPLRNEGKPKAGETTLDVRKRMKRVHQLRDDMIASYQNSLVSGRHTRLLRPCNPKLKQTENASTWLLQNA